MAIAGGATSAYRCRVVDDMLETRGTTAMRSECADVETALLRLGRGETVTVAGSDMEQLRRRLGGQDTTGATTV